MDKFGEFQLKKWVISIAVQRLEKTMNKAIPDFNRSKENLSFKADLLHCIDTLAEMRAIGLDLGNYCDPDITLTSRPTHPGQTMARNWTLSARRPYSEVEVSVLEGDYESMALALLGTAIRILQKDTAGKVEFECMGDF